MTSNPLNCREVVLRLWDFLDGEVDHDTWEAIEVHLATCTGCQSHVAFCRDFLARVAAMPIDPLALRLMRARVEVAFAQEAAIGGGE